MTDFRARWLNQSWRHLKRILTLKGVFILIGFLWRLAFLLSYGGSLQDLSAFHSDVIHAFILGARFDGTVLFYINSIPLLMWLMISLFSFWKRLAPALDKIFSHFAQFLIPYYAVMLFIVTFVSAVDFGFYSFYQDRINVLIFGFIEDDTLALIKTMWRNYPILWIFTGLGLFTYFMCKGLKLHFQQLKEWWPARFHKVSYPAFVLFFLLVFVLNGVGARGSLGLFPLSEMDTGFSRSLFVNHLGFNGVRALARAMELKSLQKSKWDSNLQYYGYGHNPRQAFADFYNIPEEQVPADPLQLLRHRTPVNAWAAKTRPHVLILTMESLGAYWLRYNQKDFDLLGPFKNHLQEDTYLRHFLSSSDATIGSLSCLMIGSPQRPISEFLTESEYLQVPFRSSPARVFKQAGYKARFLYGGNPGWREVNKFAFAQGFDAVEGEYEIEKGLQ
ncbi:MAG: LTA synthase family protein, partial [Bdellovibrio sp.]